MYRDAQSGPIYGCAACPYIIYAIYLWEKYPLSVQLTECYVSKVIWDGPNFLLEVRDREEFREGDSDIRAHGNT